MVCHETYKDENNNWVSPDEVKTINGEKYLKGEVKRKWLETKMINGSLIAEYRKPFLGKPFVINE